uniref:BPTI/Kunitz inhibitor domain-containing protein n=1 Tax=Plectus sambesii TaxID=2011161 RepID=A0A914WE07_9BILA
MRSILQTVVLFLPSLLTSNVMGELKSSGMPVFSPPDHRYPSICYLPPDSSICLPNDRIKGDSNDRVDVFHTRFYFDALTGACYPFYSEDCGRNENNFETLEDCQKACAPSSNRTWPKLACS